MDSNCHFVGARIERAKQTRELRSHKRLALQNNTFEYGSAVFLDAQPRCQSIACPRASAPMGPESIWVDAIAP